MIMEVGSQWYNRIASEISGYQLTLGQKDSKKYKLDQLLRIARRIDDFSGICTQCHGYQKEISKLVQDLSMMVQMPDDEGLKKHIRAITDLTEHLKKVIAPGDCDCNNHPIGSDCYCGIRYVKAVYSGHVC